jgi:hypothetical protein
VVLTLVRRTWSCLFWVPFQTQELPAETNSCLSLCCRWRTNKIFRVARNIACSNVTWSDPSLRHGSATARLLWLQVRITPGAWMFVSYECRVLSGRGLCDGLITGPEESCWAWCVWVWSWSFDSEEALTHWGLRLGGGGTQLSCSVIETVALWCSCLWQRIEFTLLSIHSPVTVHVKLVFSGVCTRGATRDSIIGALL